MKSVNAISGKWANEVESCDENILYKDVDVSYKDTCDKSEENLKTEENYRKIIGELENEKKKLLCFVSHLQSEVTL